MCVLFCFTNKAHFDEKKRNSLDFFKWGGVNL